MYFIADKIDNDKYQKFIFLLTNNNIDIKINTGKVNNNKNLIINVTKVVELDRLIKDVRKKLILNK